VGTFDRAADRGCMDDLSKDKSRNGGRPINRPVNGPADPRGTKWLAGRVKSWIQKSSTHTLDQRERAARGRGLMRRPTSVGREV